MGEIVPWLVFAGALAAVLGGLARLAARVRRRGVGREIMGPVDLIYRPHTHRINLEIQVQEERKVAMPSPGDLRIRGGDRAGRPDVEDSAGGVRE